MADPGITTEQYARENDRLKTLGDYLRIVNDYISVFRDPEPGASKAASKAGRPRGVMADPDITTEQYARENDRLKALGDHLRTVNDYISVNRDPEPTQFVQMGPSPVDEEFIQKGLAAGTVERGAQRVGGTGRSYSTTGQLSNGFFGSGLMLGQLPQQQQVAQREPIDHLGSYGETAKRLDMEGQLKDGVVHSGSSPSAPHRRRLKGQLDTIRSLKENDQFMAAKKARDEEEARRRANVVARAQQEQFMRDASQRGLMPAMLARGGADGDMMDRVMKVQAMMGNRGAQQFLGQQNYTDAMRHQTDKDMESRTAGIEAAGLNQRRQYYQEEIQDALERGDFQRSTPQFRQFDQETRAKWGLGDDLGAPTSATPMAPSLASPAQKVDQYLNAIQDAGVEHGTPKADQIALEMGITREMIEEATPGSNWLWENAVLPWMRNFGGYGVEALWPEDPNKARRRQVLR